MNAFSHKATGRQNVEKSSNQLHTSNYIPRPKTPTEQGKQHKVITQ